MDVTLLPWPDEDDRREHLMLSGGPRLLLIADGHPPPQLVDCLEDWIRVPVDEDELAQRVATLRARAGAHGGSEPLLDGDGLLRVGPSWVSLPPVEARLTAALLDRLGAVVSREALARAGWPDGAPGRNALDVHVLRLRRRLAPVGLVIRTVRSRGYLLEQAPSESRQTSVALA